MTQKVATLSGGEQNRLLLAKLFAETHNFLVLDEPTNDLDMETLDLLQEVVTEYDGTILIVSHDRDFLDRTVTAILAFEGDGKVSAHTGGFSDYLGRRTADATRRADREGVKKGDGKSAGKTASKPNTKPIGNRTAKLSFKDQHALDTLPGDIEALEAEITTLEARLADPELFAKNPKKFTAAADRLAATRIEKDDKELRWLEAAEKAEALEVDKG